VQHWSEQPCVRPLSAAYVAAGHNALRGSTKDTEPSCGGIGPSRLEPDVRGLIHVPLAIFPCYSKNSLLHLQEFPVSLNRELVGKPLNSLADLGARIAAEGQIWRNSLLISLFARNLKWRPVRIRLRPPPMFSKGCWMSCVAGRATGNVIGNDWRGDSQLHGPQSADSRDDSVEHLDAHAKESCSLPLIDTSLHQPSRRCVPQRVWTDLALKLRQPHGSLEGGLRRLDGSAVTFDEMLLRDAFLLSSGAGAQAGEGGSERAAAAWSLHAVLREADKRSRSEDRRMIDLRPCAMMPSQSHWHGFPCRGQSI
jgi:hypothetical protein